MAQEATPMKVPAFTLSALLALFTFHNPAAHADAFVATLKTGATVDALIETPILNGAQFTYTNTTIGLLGPGGVLSESTSVFTATYLDVTGTAGVLNVTDVCTSIDILGPPVPCQAFAFSFTNLTLGDASVIASINANAFVDANVANLNIAGGSVAGGSGSFGFNPCPSPTPEPGSLALTGTGLLASAGALRRRIMQCIQSRKEVVISA